MTSAITKEEIEDGLFRAGVRDPHVLRRLMLLIDRYSVGLARKYSPYEEADLPFEQYYYLRPGEADLAGKKIRCAGPCGKVKEYSAFHQVKRNPSGRAGTCKTCRRKASGKPHGLKDGKWSCPACGERKEHEAFPAGKKDNPRLQVSCLACISAGNASAAGNAPSSR